MEWRHSSMLQLLSLFSNTTKTVLGTSLFSGPTSVLAFLRAQLRKAEPFKLLKMLLIGPPRQGKTSLLGALQTGRVAPFIPAECSISTSTWELDKPNGGKNSVRKTKSDMTCVHLSAWCSIPGFDSQTGRGVIILSGLCGLPPPSIHPSSNRSPCTQGHGGGWTQSQPTSGERDQQPFTHLQATPTGNLVTN